MKILNLETSNFRAELTTDNNYAVKATTPMGKSLFRYKKMSRSLAVVAPDLANLSEQLTGLEASVAKLAAI